MTLIMDGSTVSLARSTAPVATRRDSRREDSSIGVNAVGGVMGFDAALDVARESLGSRARQTGSDSLSSEQMFEAGDGSARDQKAAAEREAYKRDLQTSTSTRYDRSSVGARTKSAAVRSDPGTSTAPVDGEPSPAARASAVQPEPTFPESQSPPPAGESHASPVPSSRGVNAGQQLSGAREKSHPVLPNQTNTAPDGVAGASRTVALPESGSSAEPVAGKVGQALGATRVAGVESARAAAPAGNPSASRDPQTSQRQPRSTARSQETRSENHADRTSSRSDPAPTKFDELVRSIRLRSGHWQSSARMYLNPPELGRVQIDVQMEGERLHIDVRTTNESATKLLTQKAAELRAALAQHGIIIDRFDVDTYALNPDGYHEGAGGNFEQMAEHRESAHGAGTSSERYRVGGRDTERPDAIVADREVVAERRLDIRV